MAASPTPSPRSASLLRLTAMGLLSCHHFRAHSRVDDAGALRLPILQEPYAGQAAGSPFQNYADDLPSALIAAFLWYIPVGTFVFPPLAKFLGASTGTGAVRLLKFAMLAALVWLLVGEAIYLVLSPLAPAPPGVQANDLITAALSGGFSPSSTISFSAGGTTCSVSCNNQRRPPQRAALNHTREPEFPLAAVRNGRSTYLYVP